MFAHVKVILLMAALCKAPTQDELMKVLTPFNDGINAVNELKKGPRSEWDYHVILVAEGAMAVSWVTVVSINTTIMFQHFSLHH
jgi:adenylyl cyclase-associated protein